MVGEENGWWRMKGIGLRVKMKQWRGCPIFYLLRTAIHSITKIENIMDNCTKSNVYSPCKRYMVCQT
jgi:hypothetical protein